jgi:hypothetical protein
LLGGQAKKSQYFSGLSPTEKKPKKKTSKPSASITCAAAVCMAGVARVRPTTIQTPKQFSGRHDQEPWILHLTTCPTDSLRMFTAFSRTAHLPGVHTVAVLIIEPLGSIICGRSKPKIVELSQVLSPKMLDPSGSIISAATVRCGRDTRVVSRGLPSRTPVALLNIEPLGAIFCGGNTPGCPANSRYFSHQILTLGLQCLARLQYMVPSLSLL